jgi:threonine 3-dehydrogenase
MKILVTGAGGQVGTDLIPLLLSRGHTVAAFDLAPAPATTPAGVPWIQGDVTRQEEVFDAVKASRPDSIFHLAAILSATGERIPFRAYAVNMEGTRYVLEAARVLGTKQVIFTSTIAAFGPGLDNPVGNDVSMRPTTMYGVTKVAGELLGEYYATKWGLDFRGVRFPGLISAVEPGGGTSDYVNYMYFDGVRKGAYEAFVRADTTIPLMYMPDALRALVDLAEAPAKKLKHRMFNIAAMSPRADEIAAAVARRVPGVKITFKPDPRRQAIVDSWPQALDDEVAAAEWGWKAEWDLERMTDDLLAKVRAMSGIASQVPAAKGPATKAPATKAPATKAATKAPAIQAPAKSPPKAPPPVATAKGAKK